MFNFIIWYGYSKHLYFQDAKKAIRILAKASLIEYCRPLFKKYNCMFQSCLFHLKLSPQYEAKYVEFHTRNRRNVVPKLVRLYKIKRAADYFCPNLE